MTKDDKFHLMGKRRFMKALAGVGVSATGASLLSKSTLAELTDDPVNEVPRVKFVRGGALDREDTDAEYYTIPRDEWIYTQSRYKAGQQLIRQLSSQGISPGGIDVVVTTPSTEKVASVQINERRRRKLLGTTDGATTAIKESIPDSVSVELKYAGKTVDREVPVILEEESGFHETDELETSDSVSTESSYYYDHKYRPVPGGCRIRPEKPDGSWTNCTGGTYAYDLDRSEWVHVTAAHCFDAESGLRMGQRYSYQDVGTTDKIAYSSTNWWGSRMDAATIEMYDDVDVTGQIASDSGGYMSQDIEGYVHTDWLEDNEGGGASISKRGITTGLETGDLNNVSVSNDYFTTTADRDAGDSGGPHYVYDSGYWIAGIHRGSTYSGNARGIIMQNIMDEHNLYLGSSYD